MKLHELIQLAGLRRNDVAIHLQGGVRPSSCFEVTADDFIERAEADFEIGGSSAQLNALTNAKRAIDCAIDSVLQALGYERTLPRRRKLQTLLDAGFVAPRILKRVIDARNILEHEYRSPSSDDVAEALDIAALFVGATARHLEIFESDFSLGNSGEQLDLEDLYEFRRELRFHFEPETKQFEIQLFSNAITNDRPNSISYDRIRSEELASGTLRAKNPGFTIIVSLATAGDRETRVNRALDALFAHCAAAAGA